MRATRRVLTLGLIAAVTVVPTSLPALAQSASGADVTHRQSVLTEVSPTGEVRTSRVFTQLTVAGDGEVELALPDQATKGLRNLDGFGKPRVDGDQVVYRMAASRSGVSERTVADNTADLPLSVEISYALDGEPIEPKALVGRSGEVTVTYTVRNLTAQPTEIRYFDGRQQERTETVDVAVPMVGTVSTTLDGRFLDVKAPGASVAGDGRGNTVVQWSLLLFSPLGDEEQTVSYTAHVTDAVVPEAVAQVLPVDSKSFGSLRSTAESYKGAVESTRTLTINGVLIDGNVQLLAAGAAQLLDGLGQLSDGATQLAEGLNGTAVPGARQLADGTSKARGGSRQLANGLNDLGAGATQLSDGLGSARDGGGKLAAGLGELSGGAGQLADGTGAARTGAGTLAKGLGDLNDGAGKLAEGTGSARVGSKDLADGLSQIAAGAGDATAGAGQIADGAAEARKSFEKLILPGAEKIEDGLVLIEGGLTQLAAGTAQGAPAAIAGLPQVAGGLSDLSGTIYANADGCTLTAVQNGQCGLLGSLKVANGLLQDVMAGLNAVGACAEGSPYAAVCQGVGGAHQIVGGSVTNLTAAKGQVDQLVAGAQALTGIVPLLEAYAANLGSPEKPGALLKGVRDLKQGSADLHGGLQQFRADALVPLADGTATLAGKLPALADGASAARKGAGTLASGLGQLDDGAKALNAGTGSAAKGGKDLAGGLGQLDDGAKKLADGAKTAAGGGRELSSGLGQLDDGGRKLADGARTAATGGNELADGLVQIDDGANQLADGLGDAGDGAGQIAEGLDAAADGGQQIADGTVKLSEAGMQKLIEGVSDASAGSSLLYNTIKAIDARGANGDGLAYGTVDGADASAVYKFEIAGVGSRADDGTSAPVRAAIAIGAFLAAGALGLGLRRRLA
ncbi:hypothetical protein [Egicoccus sp. AB-alg2]|uniref:hypothetical protein n=1 Tax=Egicoccus sp. AB-alg2 TaxID=3242693 RepID=UPI00359D0C9D